MKFIELFAGIGGFRYGLEQAGGYECVYANDFDKYASAIYRYHWNDGTMHEGDIRTTDASSIPEHDLICAGFPCQSFSIAGKRGGFTDTRGTLFLRYAESLGLKELNFYGLRTSEVSSRMMRGIHSKPFSERWMTWGMTVNGKCLTARITESPKIGKGCSLSQILEENVDPKYFLSEKQAKRVTDTDKGIILEQ